MPKEAYYVLIVCVTIVVLYALWKGRGLVLTKSSIKVEGAQAPANEIDVGRNAVIEGSQIGDVAGMVVQNASTSEVAPKVSVLDGANIKDAKVGDIVGVKLEGHSKER